jgi:hypothetical protein
MRLALVSWLVVMTLAPAAVSAAGQGPPAVIEIPAVDVTQELLLNDGSRMIGRVQSIGNGDFVFRTVTGAEMTVEVATVRSLGTTTGHVIRGEWWEDDPNTTRLFFAPTARSLKRGEAYFGVYEVLLPFVQVGVTDRFSVGGGTPLIFAGGDQPFWITPKFQLASGPTSAAVGILHFFNVGEDNLGIAYGVVTRGNNDRAFTVGAGYAYARDDGNDQGAPVLMLGGEHRVSRRMKVVTENYVFKGGGFVSGGLRFFGERLSADFGLVTPLFEDALVVFPMINFVRKF